MQESVCPQCDKEVRPPLNRLVQDSCGHKKCRHCLLADEIKCKQCQIVNGNNNISTDIKGYGDNKFTPVSNKNVVENDNSQSTLKSSNKSVHFENHTAVIQCNGKPKVPLDKISYGGHKEYVPSKKEPKEDLPNFAHSIETTSDNKQLTSNLNTIETTTDTKELNLHLEVNIPASDHNFKTPSIDFTRKVQRTTFSKERISKFNRPKTPAMRRDLKDVNVNNVDVNFKTPLAATNQPDLQLDLKSTRKIKLIEIPEHISVFSNPPSFQCNSCNKRFKTKGHVKYHRFCTGEIRPPHQCSYCSKGFILKTQLDIHLLKHSNDKPNTCHICQKSFYEASKLKRHLLVHSSERKLMCTECGKTYKNKEGLKIHLSTHKGEKFYDCNMCSAKFNNSSNLKRHLNTHSDGKSHMCDLCGKTFKMKWALLVHRKSHSRKRDFHCEICLKTFVLKKDLQRHILTHDLNGYTTYTCSVCSTTFRRRDNLHRHVKNSHPNKKAEVIVKKHEKLRLPATMKVTAERNPVVIDNPNAINVITAPPAFTKNIGNTAGSSKTALSYVAVSRDESNVDIVDSRTTVSASANAVEGYNGPPKLAFKGTAFKMHYNIKRDCDYIHPTQVPHPISMSESVDICHKIMSPSTSYTCPISPNIDEKTSTEIYQKILCADVPSDNQKKVCLIDSVVVRQKGEFGYKTNRPGLTINEDAAVGLSSLEEHNKQCESPDREIFGVQAPILNLSQTVDICKRIMSPSTDYTDPTKNVDDLTFKRNCQRILSPPPDVLPAFEPLPQSVPQIFDSPEEIIVPGTMPLSESVDIYQQIMSPSTDFKDPTKSVDERAFKETCQKILSISVDSPGTGSDINVSVPSLGSLQDVSSPHFSNYTSPRSDFSQYSSPGVSPRPGLPQYSSSLHYSSSFQNQKHAVIKSIKFKVPREYTKTFKVQNQQPPSVIVNNSNVIHKPS